MNNKLTMDCLLTDDYVLFIVFKPEMITSLRNITVLPSHSFNLSCLAFSLGLLKYKWKRRDGILPQAAVQSYIDRNLFDPLGEETTSVYNLAVHNVQPSDEGWYCCVATNEAGSTVNCAWLEVNSKLTHSLLNYSYVCSYMVKSYIMLYAHTLTCTRTDLCV